MSTKFRGFHPPERNWSKLPHELIDALPDFTSGSELKVVLYVLRHTWGFQEFGISKRITLDEFQNGRKRKNGSRMDNGTGLSQNSIKSGVARAVKHGFLIQVPDGRDLGRQSHAYQLRMSEDDRVSKVDTLMSEVDSQPSQVDTRSEKDTIERKRERRFDSNFPSSDFSTETETEEDDDFTSEAIAITIEKLSRKFGDMHHLSSNITRAHNLWDRSGMYEEDFIEEIEGAAGTTLEAVSKSQVKDRDKRMPYFFAVLEGELGLRDGR